MIDNQWMHDNNKKYIFIYGGLNLYDISNIFGTPLEELLKSKHTMAVEARGWKLLFAGGLKEDGAWMPTM